MTIEPYILILMIVETGLLFVISFILFYKSVHVTKLTEQLESFKDKLESLSSLPLGQNDFLPMLVHELRSPLSVIKGASDLLIKEAEGLSKDQIETLLDQIRNSSVGLLDMVNDILDVSKMGAGKFEINKVFGNINDILKEECSYFESLAKVKNISLNCVVNQDLPNFSFDPNRLKQVLNNLISNSLKFTPTEGQIIITSRKVDHHVQVEIADTGVGVTDEDKPLLFKKFSQANNHQGVKEKGTGLGLVISKGIVDAHKGSIWVEDNQPKGAKFIFTLPLE